MPLQTTLRRTLKIDSTTDVTLPHILDQLGLHFRAQTNLVVDRMNFLRRTQQEGETFDHFYTQLQELMSVADLGANCDACREPILHTLIILGIRNEEIRRSIMRHSATLTLDAFC